MTDAEKVQLTIDGYDRIADMWDGTRRTDWPEVTSMIDSLLESLSNDAKVLDAGCGNARILSEIADTLAQKRIHYTGLDVSKNLLQIASDRYKDLSCVSFKHFDGVHFPKFENKISGNTESMLKFDLIISTAVLHHIPPSMQEEWLCQLVSRMRSNSKIIISIWHRSSAAQNFEINKEEIEGFAQLENIRYIYNFEEAELLLLFTNCNLEIIEFKKLKRPNSNNENWVVIANK